MYTGRSSAKTGRLHSAMRSSASGSFSERHGTGAAEVQVMSLTVKTSGFTIS